MASELKLGTVQTYSTLSGYVYIHIPQYLVKRLNIPPSTSFSIIYKDGKIILEQEEVVQNAV